MLDERLRQRESLLAFPARERLDACVIERVPEEEAGRFRAEVAQRTEVRLAWVRVVVIVAFVTAASAAVVRIATAGTRRERIVVFLGDHRQLKKVHRREAVDAGHHQTAECPSKKKYKNTASFLQRLHQTATPQSTLHADAARSLLPPTLTLIHSYHYESQ